MFNKELTKCDIITIIAGDCQNAEEKFIQISTEFVQAITGKSFSEALILPSTNPQFDKRLLIELRVQ